MYIRRCALPMPFLPDRPRISLNVVRVDRHDCDAAWLILTSKSRELVADVLDEGAVIADERDYQSARVVEVSERRHLALEIGQAKVGCTGAEFEHRGLGSHGGLEWREEEAESAQEGTAFQV